jgi:ABC-type glycerol-3-phosphate transport system substrate-binding protein
MAGTTLLFASGEKEGAAGAEGEVTNLSFWNMPFVTQEVSPEYVNMWEDRVGEALTGVSVDNFYGPGKYSEQRQKFLVQAKSGTPDVIEGLIEDAPVYVQRDVIEPLTDRFDGWEEQGQFVESTLTPLRMNGELWGIPYNTNARAMVYRKDLFDEYGLETPQTWTELIRSARTITERTNKETFGLFLCTKVGGPRSSQEFISWFYQVNDGEHMFEVEGDEVTINATVEDFTKVLTLYDEAFKGEYPAADPNERGNGWESEDPGFVNGNWAMAPMGPWLWGRRQDSEKAKDILENRTGIMSLPVIEGGTPATYLEVKAIFMNKHTEDKDAAWDLIKFITSKEMMARWLVDSGGIPPREDSLQMDLFQESDIGWWIQGYADELGKAVALAPVNWGPVNEANLRAVNFVIYDRRSPQEAAQWLMDELTGLKESGEL